MNVYVYTYTHTHTHTHTHIHCATISCYVEASWVEGSTQLGVCMCVFSFITYCTYCHHCHILMYFIRCCSIYQKNMPCKVPTQIPDETTRSTPQKKINQLTCSKRQNFRTTDTEVPGVDSL
jgi:hypothetical protein